jgi:PAS domain S-box-containing protein
MDNLPDRIFFKDRDGRFLRNNLAHLREFGLEDQAQAIGRTDTDFFSEDHARQAAEDERMVMSTGFAIHKEERVVWPDGWVDWALVTKLPLSDEHGQVIGTFGIARDINELKRVQEELVQWQKELETRVKERTEELARTNAALEEVVRKHEFTEEALRQSEERIRQVVEATPSALITVNASGRITLVNSQTERLFGYRREDLLNQSVELLVPERFRGQHSHLRTGYFNAAEARPMGAGRDLFGLRKDGTEVPIEIGLNPIRTAEGSFVLASIIDITERQQTEQVTKDSLREKETLLKEVHHRVKNNLQIISSVLQLQAGYLRDPQALSAFRECQHRIRSMALIHEKLYQAGNFARINFAEYAQSLVSILVRSYNSPYCAVKLNYEIEAVSLNLDTAIPFALILNEAVSNSLEHAFRGQPRGNIWVRLRQADEGELILSVQDDGIGLADELETEHPSSLGLRLIRILADQLHGTIEIRRHPGTTITLSTRPNAGEKANDVT